MIFLLFNKTRSYCNQIFDTYPTDPEIILGNNVKIEAGVELIAKLRTLLLQTKLLGNMHIKHCSIIKQDFGPSIKMFK